MYLGLCAAGAIAVVWAIAILARPDTGRPRGRDLARRTHRLRACPDRATILDVEQAMRAHPLPEATVERVLRAAAARRIGSRTLWCWLDRFGADKLVLVVDADVAERRMQRHLDAGTTPDWEALAVFADLTLDSLVGSMPVAEILDLDAVPSVEELSFDVAGWETPSGSGGLVATDDDLGQFDHLPPIFEPGLPRARPVAPPAGGDDPWPMVA
ncbi:MULTISPECIES: hypothetical protein [unclassified Nocardioides]|uniref:hypothetical protein n=1 Tax=unclassified Nocardioides TaxID=2615069 RepID=UPI003623EB78